MRRFLFCTMLLFYLSPLQAQSPELAGKNELSLHGFFDFEAPNGDKIDFHLGYGWFLRDDLMLGGQFQWSLLEDIAPGDYRSQQINFVTDWLFPDDSALVPYIGAQIGFRASKFGNQEESGLVFGGRVGARYFLNDSVSINASLSMLNSSEEVFFADFEAEDQYFFPSIGISAVF